MAYTDRIGISIRRIPEELDAVGAQQERANAIRPKYDDLLWRHPIVWSVGIAL